VSVLHTLLRSFAADWYEDDGDAVGGPYEDEEQAIEAANNGNGWL
jgi:hypothetical protein